MTHLIDVLKLEVGDDPAGDVLNLAPNPGGAEFADYGAWGWSTENDTAFSAGAAGDATGITFTTTATGTQRLRTQWIDLAPYLGPADQIAASWKVVTALPAGLYYRAKLIYRAFGPTPAPADGTPTGYLTASGTVDLAPVAIPWLPDDEPTIQVALAFDFYGNTSGGAPAAGLSATIKEVTVAVAATAGELTPLGYLPSFDWTNILGPTHEIKINRAPLDAGTLSARIIDTTLDPVTATTLRFGRPVRVRALNADTSAWEMVFYGRIENADTSYDLKRPADKQVAITLTGYDANAVLARTKQPDSAPHLQIIGAMLTAAGLTTVPWNVEGRGGVIPAVDDTGDPWDALTLAPTNPDATLIDQLAFLRDTNLGYIWVDKSGVLRAEGSRTGEFYDGAAVIDESAYSDIGVAFDPSQIINVVSFEIYTTGADGEPVVETRGPIRDEASIAEWGEHPATFKVIGPIIEVDDAEVGGDVGGSPLLAMLDEIFDANDIPAARVKSVRIPIRTPADITTDRALIDLYANAQVINTDRGIDQVVRVLTIEHTITATTDNRWHWLTDLGFAGASRPAAPAGGSSPAGALVGVGGVGTPPGFWQDTFEVVETGDQGPLYLTRTPIREGSNAGSLHVYWNGWFLPATNWTLDGNQLTVLDPDGRLRPEDVITAAYAYDKATSAPAGAPAPSGGTLVAYQASGWKWKQIARGDNTDYSGAAYDDSAWATAAAAFGHSNPANTPPTGWPLWSTVWDQATRMWARRTVAATAGVDLNVTVRGNRGVAIYLNGVQVGAGTQISTEVTYVIPGASVLASNKLAIRITDDTYTGSGTGCYFDAEVTQ